MVLLAAVIALIAIPFGIWWLVKTANRVGAFEDLKEPEKGGGLNAETTQIP